MKRFLCLCAALAAILALTACGGRQAASKNPTGGAPSVSQLLEGAGDTSAEPEIIAPPPAETEPDPNAPPPPAGEDGIDIDLTQMSSTMVYAEVSNLMYMPDDYIGKIVRMTGDAVSSPDPKTGVVYHAVIIRDATACCASGLDYVLSDGDYPPDNTEVTVTGEFELYEENGLCYCRLKDARLENTAA